MSSDSSAQGPAAARFISNQQWEAEVEIAFSPTLRDQEPKIDQLLADRLLEKLKVQRVTYTLRKQIGLEGRLNYGLRLWGSEGPEQFRKGLFAAIDPTIPFTDGPALLELIGSVKPGEPLALILESNLASGYAWEIETLDALKVQPKGAMQFQSPGKGLGVSTKQIIPLEGLAEGDTAIRLLYRRPWIESRAPKMQMTLRAAEISLISDLSNPTPPPDQTHNSGSLETSLPIPSVLALPASFDWRNFGIITPVRDQGNCGSCWAFGTVGPFEASLKWKGSLTKDLSEEFLLSCNTDGYSCDGGWWAHEYHLNKVAPSQTQAGAVLEADFPYTETKTSCTQALSHPFRLTNWGYVGDGYSIPPIESIKNAIYSYGPVAAAVCAGWAMMTYPGGIFNTDDDCGLGVVNHGVVLVGWNDSDNTWIMRNSWGTDWGESGYMRITRGTSKIGYSANYVMYSTPFTATHWIYFPLIFYSRVEPLSSVVLRNGDF
jgi:C1A family cysteine protease/predicted secreted protein